MSPLRTSLWSCMRKKLLHRWRSSKLVNYQEILLKWRIWWDEYGYVDYLNIKFLFTFSFCFFFFTLFPSYMWIYLFCLNGYNVHCCFKSLVQCMLSISSWFSNLLTAETQIHAGKYNCMKVITQESCQARINYCAYFPYTLFKHSRYTAIDSHNSGLPAISSKTT